MSGLNLRENLNLPKRQDSVEKNKLIGVKDLDLSKIPKSVWYYLADKIKNKKTDEIESFDGYLFKIKFLDSKHQVVLSIEVRNEIGERSNFILRPTKHNFVEFYKNSKVVRKNFPKLFFSVKISDTESVLFIEEIDGVQGGKSKGDVSSEDRAEYFHALSNEDNFEKLVDEMYMVLKELYQEDKTLRDTRPAVGHNIIYSKLENKFKLFDVDTLVETKKKYFLSILFRFLNFSSMYPASKVSFFEAKFIRDILKKYIDEENDGEFISVESEIIPDVQLPNILTEDAFLKLGYEKIDRENAVFESLFAQEYLLGRINSITNQPDNIFVKYTKYIVTKTLDRELIEALKTASVDEFQVLLTGKKILHLSTEELFPSSEK